MFIRGQLMMFRLAAFLSCIAVPTSASTPSCATKCYNVGIGGTFNCNFGNFTCYCQPPASDTYLKCVEDTCNKADVQPAITWAKKNCGGYDFSVDGAFATMTETAGAITSSSLASSFVFTSSVDVPGTSRQDPSSSETNQNPKPSSSTATDQSSNNKASDGGLSTSDIIAIAVGVSATIATVVGTFFVVKAYLRRREIRRKQETSQ
ncbi:hypothetical protein G7Y79_00053g088290 [Physcia stellaris]|nr:hypothetical protein G7Y79_00053g088290 [Physcia stellaris]